MITSPAALTVVGNRFVAAILSIFLYAALAFPSWAAANPLADALDASTMSWTTGGNASWQAQTSVTRDGVDAGKSGTINDGQESWMQTTVTGPGMVNFWWKVSSESGYDYLRFYVNGVEQSGKISGTVDWTRKSYGLAAGSHTLKWAYTKDTGESSGSDCGWVDQVELSPPAPEISVEQPDGIDLIDGGTGINFRAEPGSNMVKTFTINNSGTLELTGLTLSKDGTDASDFTLGTLGATSLAAGASTTFTVTFAPGLTGLKTAAIHIASNDADENPFDIELTGITVPYTYTTSGGQVTITGYTGSGGAVVIPGMIDGMPVVSIGDEAFYGWYSVTSVIIPTSITSIGWRAFSDCSALTSVTISQGVISIGSNAFYRCTSLTSVTIPNSVTSIGSYAFYECTSLASVTIPNSVTSIGGRAFQHCSSLASITLPGGITSIEDYTFMSCRSLTNITIPSSVTSIGDWSFAGCYGLTAVTIPTNTTSIGNWAFSGCGGLTVVIMSNNVTSIGESSFEDCTSLTSLTLPQSVVNIGDAASSGCSSLAKVNIPNGVTHVRMRAFEGCKSLTSVTIPNGVNQIGLYAFFNCTSLNRITIPNSVASIWNYAFRGCTSLTHVTIPNGVIRIPDAFRDCTSLISVSIPNSVTTITGSFGGCTSLTNVTIPNSVTSISFAAFGGCTSLTSVTIPYGITSIGDSAFTSCSSLESITIPNSVTSIGYGAFNRCTSLKSITIPNSVVSVEDYAFFRCDFLTRATFLGNAPKMGGSYIFAGVASAFTIYYPLGANGFTSPKWKGYPAKAFTPSVEIVVQQPAGKNLKDGISSKSFGSVSLKSTSTKTFTIKNTGTANLTGLAVTKTGANSKDFSVKAPLKTSLPPGASTTFKVTFKPSAKGNRKAVIHIRSNDKDENPFDITLTGKGLTRKKAAPSAARLPSWREHGGTARLDHDARQSTGTVRLADGRRYLTLTIMKSPEDCPVNSDVEVSPNLVNWYSGSKHTTVIADDASILKVRDNTPLAPETKRYIRLNQIRQ